jgi:hypothetical protein
MPTKSDCYTQRCFYSPGDITVTFDTPTVHDIHLEDCRIAVDTKGEGVPYVGDDEGIQTVDKAVADVRIEATIPWTNDTLLQQFFADPNTADGQINITAVLNKEELLADGLSAPDPVATDTQITLTGAQAGKLHHGQTIVIKETGLTTSYYIVDTANSGTGVVTLQRALGVNFSVAAYVYVVDYLKVVATHCIIHDLDLDDKSSDNPIKRKFTFEPLGDYPTTIACQISFWP